MLVYKLRCWERAGDLLDAKPREDIVVYPNESKRNITNVNLITTFVGMLLVFCNKMFD